jgi:hypothetical protein
MFRTNPLEWVTYGWQHSNTRRTCDW